MRAYILLALAGLSLVAAGAGAELVGRTAPQFVLPRIGQEGEVSSDTLFYAYGTTLVTFWTTHCAECTRRLEACQTLHEWGVLEGLGVVAVNFDEYPTARTQLQAESTLPGALHLYDPGGRLAAAYGAGSHSFSAFVIDAMGVIRAVHHEILPDDILALQPGLAARLAEAFGEEAPPPSAPRRPGILDELGILADRRIALAGRGRMRWMRIDTTGTGASGANGEPLLPGASLRQRMELELSYAVTPNLHAGGLIRLSNEGALVLRSGPDYLSSESGSFFLRHAAQAGPCRSRLSGGYYRVYLSPLTLMRWDQDDTPVSGGQRAQGCGVCGGDAGAAGFIRSESLEQLGPDLAFEGARWDLSYADRLDLLLLYARPQTPLPEDPAECCDPGLPSAETFFHQDLYAGRALLHIALPWRPDPLELAATAISVREDPDNPACAAICMRDPFDARVLGADLRLPLPGRLDLLGELATSHGTLDKEVAPHDHYAGSAFIFGAVMEMRASAETRFLGLSLADLRARCRAAYLRVENSFYSPYSALSYEPNLQGFRAALRVDWGPVGVGGFYKRQEPIRMIATPDFATPVDDEKVTASAWADAVLWPGGVLMGGVVFERRDIYVSDAVFGSGALGPYERQTLVFSAVQALGPGTSLLGEIEWLEGEWLEGVGGTGVLRAVTREYTSTVSRIMLEVEF